MPSHKAISIPEYLDCAAFLVENHIITQVNEEAKRRQFPEGADIREIISIGSQEYSSFQSGKLYLELHVSGVTYRAGVTVHEGAHLFCILSNYESTELQALALAASDLRSSLQIALFGTELLSKHISEENASAKKNLGQINHGLFRLLRTVQNMSDASNFPQLRTDLFEYLDAGVVFAEFIKKLQETGQALNRTFRYTGPGISAFTMMDRQALERAFYNLISNAVKFSPEGSTILIRLKAMGNRLYLTVENQRTDSSVPVLQYFDRYLRQPGVEDLRYGIGLGLPVVRTVASAHHGTLLVEPKKGENIAFTMTIAIEEDRTSLLYSPFDLKLNLNGGFDTALVELSELLPNSQYEQL